MNEPILLAGCVVLDDYGRFLLLHRYRDAGQWELPGGKVEEDETPDAAAVREIREELGVSVSLIRPLGSELFEEDDQQYRYHWFLAKIVAGEPEVMETDKFDDLDYFEIEDTPSLALSPNMLILQDKLLSGEVQLKP